MKTFYILVAFLLMFTACSSNNAFDNFKMDKDQELSVSNLQSAKIMSSDARVNGLFSNVASSF